MINEVGAFHVQCNIVLLSENFIMRILVLFMLKQLKATSTTHFGSIYVRIRYILCTSYCVYDMLNKNTPGVKKARPSRKHQLALIHTCD